MKYVCKRVGDQRTDYRVGSSPALASRESAPLPAPVTLSFEMQLNGDGFSLSLATHTNTPQYIYQATTLILRFKAHLAPGHQGQLVWETPILRSWLQHRMQRSLPFTLTPSLQAAAVKKQKETQLLRQADLLVLPAIADQANT